jgi:hypothetical protein
LNSTQFSWLATLWGSSVEVKAPILFSLGFIFLFSAILVYKNGLKLSQKARFVEFWDIECVSSFWQLNEDIILAVVFKKAFGNSLVGIVNTLKTLRIFERLEKGI